MQGVWFGGGTCNFGVYLCVSMATGWKLLSVSMQLPSN